MFERLAGKFNKAILTASRDVGWLIATYVSRGLNAATGGKFKEPLCARVGRNAYLGEQPVIVWQSLSWALDLMFFLDRRHCFRSFIRYSTRQEMRCL